MGCSLPGSAVHGIFQARTLQWAAIPSPGDRPPLHPPPRDWIWVSPALQADSLPSEPPGKPWCVYTHVLSRLCPWAPTSHGGPGVTGPWHGMCLLRSERQKLSGFLKAWAWKYTSCQLRELQGQASLKGRAHTGYECGSGRWGAHSTDKTHKQSFTKQGGFYSLKPHSLFPGPVMTSYLPVLKRGWRCQSEGRDPDWLPRVPQP